MHIRSFIGAALLGLAMMASAPIAMADPAPDICVLELPSENFLETAAPEFQAPAFAICEHKALPASHAFLSPDGDDEDAAHPRFVTFPAKLDFVSARLHYDPGRLLA
ncbi:hypothetical protein JHL21_02560 [Devosia sp. WQ 349]|uniref:hypothetical protein n=1 Tax=Devosia sp. WQ 349K1 TaxID=2800329 RepID=UPI0019089D27|nr:hypothetical protein [Devosia sp. WQ 349K1]MBK1793378.1 hypothetical protein [Devosia sp. WQ 349K1]